VAWMSRRQRGFGHGMYQWTGKESRSAGIACLHRRPATRQPVGGKLHQDPGGAGLWPRAGKRSQTTSVCRSWRGSLLLGSSFSAIPVPSPPTADLSQGQL
jgi:hypothetical protein